MLVVVVQTQQFRWSVEDTELACYEMRQVWAVFTSGERHADNGLLNCAGRTLALPHRHT